MRAQTRNFLIGLTSLTGIAGGVFLLMLFGELDAIIKPRYVLTFNSTHAEGLRKGSTIELNGVPIGLVVDIASTEDRTYPVRIVAEINQSVLIPANVKTFTNPAVLGGSSTLRLESSPGEGAAPGTLANDGTAELSGEIHSQLLEQITSELDKRMEPLLAGLEEFRNLARNLNDLVEPVDPDDPAAALNIRTAVKTLNEVLVGVHEALVMAKNWLGDDQLRLDARTAVANANVLIERATGTIDEYARLAHRIEADSASITTQLVPVLADLGEMLSTVRMLTERATAGKGTVGQLLTNPDLYNSLNDAAIQLDRTLLELQLLVEKYKAEGVIIQF